MYLIVIKRPQVGITSLYYKWCLKIKWLFLVIGTWSKSPFHLPTSGHRWDVLFQNVLGFWDTDLFCNHYVLWSGMKFWEIVGSCFLWKDVLNHVKHRVICSGTNFCDFCSHIIASLKVHGNTRDCSFNHVEDSQTALWTFRIGLPNNWIFALLSVSQPVLGFRERNWKIVACHRKICSMG